MRPSWVPDLCAGLGALAAALRGLQTPEYIVKALDTLAHGPDAEASHVTAVVGEKGRGKTSLVNRLLCANVLPTARNGYENPLRLRWADTWMIVDASDGKADTEIPIPSRQRSVDSDDSAHEEDCAGAVVLPSDPPIVAVHGPSRVLKFTTLLDTPALNDVALDYEERVVAELVHADCFLICLSASQMLSQNERETIRHRLLPFLGGDGALVVTHMDLLDDESVTDDDRHSIRSRADRFGVATKLPVFFLPSDRAATPSSLVDFVEVSAKRHLHDRTSLWRRKVAVLLGGIERSLVDIVDAELDGQSTLATQPSNQERLRELAGLVDSEHSLALSEAESTLRQSLASIRMGLRDLTATWTPDYAQGEGLSMVAAEAQRALADAIRRYLDALQQSLTASVPRSVKLAAEKISRMAQDVGSACVRTGAGPGKLNVAQPPKSVVPMVLAATAFLALAVYPPAFLVAAASAAAISHIQRRTREEAFVRNVRSSAADTLSRWLAEDEPRLVEQLCEAVKPVRAALHARIEEAVMAIPPPSVRVPQHAVVLEKTRACLALAAPVAPVAPVASAAPTMEVKP